MGSKLFPSFILFMFSTSLVVAHGGAPGKPTERRAVAPGQLQLNANDINQKEMHGKLIQQKNVGDFELKFKIVDVKDSVPDGGSHNLLVSIKRDGRNQKRLTVNSTVDDRHGEIKSKSMMELGDWHLAGYDFAQDGEYVITVSFESASGVTHSSTINYP